MMRNSRLSLVADLLNLVSEFISIFIFLYTLMRISLKFTLILSIVWIMLSFVIRVLSWYHNTFSIQDNVFYAKQGIFSKKEIKVPLHTIASVDLKSTFKQRLFKLQTLVIDQGTLSEGEPLQIILRNAVIETFRTQLLSAQTTSSLAPSSTHDLNDALEYTSDTPTQTATYKVSKKDLFIYSVTKNHYIPFFFLIFSAYFFLSEIIHLFEWRLTKHEIIQWLPLIFIGSILSFKLLSIAINIMKYTTFELKKVDYILEISSGLFTKYKTSLNLNTVSAVKISQSPLQKYTKSVSITVSTLGYGDEMNEEAIVFLNISESYVPIIMERLFKEYLFEGQMHTISPRHRFRFKRHQFGYTNDLLCLQKTGLYNKWNMIAMQQIQDVTCLRTPINKRHNTYTLKIRYKAMKYGDLHHLFGLDIKDVEHIVSLIL